jgi:hypothetical protein
MRVIVLSDVDVTVDRLVDVEESVDVPIVVVITQSVVVTLPKLVVIEAFEVDVAVTGVVMFRI